MNNNLADEKIIFNALKKTKIGILVGLDLKNEVILRTMYYGFDDSFNLYLISPVNSLKVKELINKQDISFYIMHEDIVLQNSFHIKIKGRIEILKEDKDKINCVKMLDGRNPLLTSLGTSVIPKDVYYLNIMPSRIYYESYAEILNNKPPVILE